MITPRELALAEALRMTLVKAGVLRPDACPTCPELLVAAEDYAGTEWKETGEVVDTVLQP